MIKKSYVLIYKYLIYILFGILFFYLLNNVINSLNIYYKENIYILLILYISFGINIYLNIKYINFIIYLMTLFVFLFLRNTEVGVNLDFYLLDWIKKIFENKTIFINIIGNIILFIPMGVYFRKKIIYGFSITILIELLQYVLKKGIFDIVDIFLNNLGVVIGILGAIIWITIKRKKKSMSN